MKGKKILVALSATSAVSAQRPADVPICDYYTTALLKDNTAENQLKLLTLLVNTVVIGNYTAPNVGVAVPGILAPGKVEGVDVNLLPYFDGSMATSNRGGSSGVAVNSLDGGGAEPIMMNMPANSETSNQYFLLTHLYAFFGSLLGCTTYGMPGFPAYEALASQYKVHKFMELDHYEVSYFIQQVGLAASSFGVAEDDITAVATALDKLFNYRCLPPATVIKEQGPQLHSICTDETCPLAEGAVCDDYKPAMPSASPSAGGSNSTATDGMGNPASPSATGGSGGVDDGMSPPPGSPDMGDGMSAPGGSGGASPSPSPSVQVAGATVDAAVSVLLSTVAPAFLAFYMIL
ncbi:hypothetical protein DHEL01_v202386 [Diaporthe helianthi]|uniref:Heme haloperoxidase family profile domain-containing protein n=1 Tax=Diaporthe helianthi TaxID=158607 RepID=A0A2P5I9Q6_DIAHE|nr:hypothetical protein DHEL01_v202386 [Diaporthe helianthi]